MAYSTHVTLLTRLADGIDPAAWGEFHERYGDLIRGFARRYALQPTDCDDVVQEVLLALSKSMSGFEYDPAKGKFRSFLKTLALRVIFRKIRQDRRLIGQVGVEGLPGDPAADPANETLWEEEWQRYHVRQAMRGLEAEFNEQDRMAFTEYAMKGRPAAETAESLGMSVDQVYQAKSRILKRLSEFIAEQVTEEG